MLLLVLLQLSMEAQQHQKTWIFFRSKPQPALTGNLREDAVRFGISERALRRRAKVLPKDALISECDYPIDPDNLKSVESTGATIRVISRWFNAVSVVATEPQLSTIRSLPQVQTTERVAVMRRSKPITQQQALEKPALNTSSDYGQSLTQLSTENIIDVHRLGINGKGVLVGMLDNGYNLHRTHDALKNIDVVAEYDFIQQDNDTQIAPGELPTSQGSHGCATLSTLVGFAPGNIVGAAYGASVLLGKTEVDGSETQIEEDYFVQGLEWEENWGADIVSVSIGYNDWYTYGQLNGKTAVTTKAASMAASLGVLMVVAMGNEYPYQPNSYKTGTLLTPADAEGIVAVGAIYSDGKMAEFSSTGPTADGRIKPEVVAQGKYVRVASDEATYAYARVDGTSLSTPLTAGVAALVLSNRPELTPAQVREALIKTTRKVSGFPNSGSYPNNFYGYGIINAVDAVLYHGMAISNQPLIVDTNNTYIVTVWIRSNQALLFDSLAVYYRGTNAPTFNRVQLLPTGQPYTYKAVIPKSLAGTSPRFYIVACDANGDRRTVPYEAPLEMLSLTPTQSNILNRFPETTTSIPFEFQLYQNYPNPFNPTTVIVVDAPRAESAQLAIFNILGERVRTLFHGITTTGANVFLWNGKNENGALLPSGVYIYRLTTSSTVNAKKMILVR